ncbi:peptidoglycan DD-metalloendopeptidase family protein, partial [Candidatus Kuenenbacteria bacterium]|nr:peptidoglycan DD-metalloendopeptidase family protein [Candidatus Kuenenbacteria bacterium]
TFPTDYSPTTQPTCSYNCYLYKNGDPHGANDYSVASGTNIYAAASGSAMAHYYPNTTGEGSYGYMVTITHANGYLTRYAHLSGYVAKIRNDQTGVWVEQGELIGYSGNSGGPWRQSDNTLRAPYHLHFEVQKNGVRVNPYDPNNYLWTTNPPSPAKTPPLVGFLSPNGTIDSQITPLFKSFYDVNGGATTFGFPWDNGGTNFVHDWGDLEVQDFLKGDIWCQLVLNPWNNKVYAVWNKILRFWNSHYGYRDYGAPYTNETEYTFFARGQTSFATRGDKITVQKFAILQDLSRKTIIYNPTTNYVGHCPVGVFTFDMSKVPAGYYLAEHFDDGSTIPLPNVPTNNGKREWLLQAGSHVFWIIKADGQPIQGQGLAITITEGNEKVYGPSDIGFSDTDPGSGGSSGGGSSGGSSGGSGGSSGGGGLSGGSGGGQIPTLHLDDPHDGQIIFLADQTKRPFFISNIGHGILECTVSTSGHSWLVVKYTTLGYYAENYVDTVFVNYGAMSSGTNIGYVYLSSSGGSATITVTANKTDSSPVNPPNYNHNPAFTSFTVSPASGSAPLIINCSATIQDQDDDPTTLIWDFGDGITSSQLVVSHFYSNSGQYTVKATASDGKGESATHEQQVTVTEGAKLWANYDGLGFARAYDISGSFVLGNSGNATLNWSMTDIPVWLSVNPIGGIISVGKNDTVIVTPIDSKTPVGNSYADLKITSNGGDWNVHIIMNKPAQTPKLYFPWDIVDCDSTLVDKGYKIKNPGTDTLHWQLLEDIAWLSVRPSSGSVAPNGKIDIHFIANRSVLSSGGYSPKVYLNSNGGNKELVAKIFMPQPSTPKPTNHEPSTTEPPPVTPDPVIPPPVFPSDPALIVPPPTGPTPITPPAVLYFPCDGFGFGENTLKRMFDLENDGGDILVWSVLSEQPFIVISPNSGNLAAGSKVTLTFEAKRIGLTDGVYFANVLFTSNIGNKAIIVCVTCKNMTGAVIQANTNLAGEVGSIPTSFILYQNYPNPFNPETTISYDLPEQCAVKLIIYDLRGREVEILADENQFAGNHLIRWQPTDLSSGMYLCRLIAGGKIKTQKMLFTK